MKSTTKWLIGVCLGLFSCALFAQQCCECRGAQGPFKAPIPAGYGANVCSTTCAASGGTSTGKVSTCFNPMPSPSPQAGGNYCPMKEQGGNCKGNSWCQCGTTKFRRLINGAESEVDIAQIKVGDELEVVFDPRFGGSVAAGYRTELQSSATIYWGDGETTLIALAPKTFKHKYQKEGEFVAYVNLWGAYKWNGNDGSCSYECTWNTSNNNGLRQAITVRVASGNTSTKSTGNSK